MTDSEAFEAWFDEAWKRGDVIEMDKPSAGRAWQAALASERAKQAEPVAHYECSGCGHVTNDPDGDLSDIRAKGYLSCCPDRKMIAAPTAVQDSWEETARQYAENARFWREKYEATQKQAEPIPASILVTMYAENPTSDADMIEFAREVERAHGIIAAPTAVQSEPAQQKQPRIPTSCGYCTFEEADGELIEQCPRCKAADAQQAAPPADDEAVRLLRKARSDVEYALVNSSGKGRSARAALLAAIDAYLAKVKK